MPDRELGHNVKTEEEFVVIFMQLLAAVADGASHFVGIFFCSQKQANIIKKICMDVFPLRCDQMTFERHVNPPHNAYRLGSALEYGVVIYGNIIQANINNGGIASNIFSQHRFGKWPKGTADFHFRKPPRLIRFLLQRYASFDEARVTDLFAGSLSALRAALHLGISLDFVEKDPRQIELWPHQKDLHFDKYAKIIVDSVDQQYPRKNDFIDDQAEVQGDNDTDDDDDAEESQEEVEESTGEEDNGKAAPDKMDDGNVQEDMIEQAKKPDVADELISEGNEILSW